MTEKFLKQKWNFILFYFQPNFFMTYFVLLERKGAECNMTKELN